MFWKLNSKEPSRLRRRCAAEKENWTRTNPAAGADCIGRFEKSQRQKKRRKQKAARFLRDVKAPVTRGRSGEV